MFLKYLIKIVFLIPIVSFCQSGTILGIREDNCTLEIRNGDEVLKNEDPLTIFYYTYSFNKTKDTILVYKKNSPINSEDTSYNSYTYIKNSSNKAELIIKNNDNVTKNLNISFTDKLKSININKSSFFLNQSYYSYLKKNLNISELVDLLDDFLQEDIYQLNDLKYIKSNAKYKNKNFKILKAKITTVNMQNESIITNWNVFYLYNKNSILTSVKQQAKDETRYTKTLISNIKNTFSYKIYWQVDERFSDDKEITFSVTQNNYSEKGTYLQTGLNKETDYETTAKKSIKLASPTLKLDENQLAEVYEKLNK